MLFEIIVYLLKVILDVVIGKTWFDLALGKSLPITTEERLL
ncbi:hypothetical protein VspSTUT11_23940 [Vibrio sp. STUT-A11]|nr:hypothetical protein VspSTUT11_23940 [Vibrio sp. STUT-A11]